jgi:tRNA(Ile)-lysidine synthase
VHKFVRELLTEWRRLELPFADQAIVVAVSGGADSVSLLLALDQLKTRKKLKLRVVAALFDHKLRPESSGTDLEFVRDLTVTRKIELAVGAWDHQRGGNLEQEARRARYDFLKRTAANVDARFIVTGHTMNDQAETVLMNLIRGSGIDGLGGMRVFRNLETERHAVQGETPMLPFPDDSLQVVRPLMRWARRSDTENFCSEMDVKFCLDPMNEDVTFRRVWIRKVLIPMLAEVNPKIVETLSRTSILLQQAPAVETETASATDVNLHLATLRNMSQPELYSALRGWLRTKRGNLRGIKLVHLEAVEQLINSRKSGKVVELPRGIRISRQDGELVYDEIKVDK